jgi:hypothetical protein
MTLMLRQVATSPIAGLVDHPSLLILGPARGGSGRTS